MRSPEQLSILAAEVLGWQDVEHRHGRTPDEDAIIGWQPPLKTQPQYKFQNKSKIPAFHTDANASMQLVEWMAKPENGELDWFCRNEADGVLFAFSGKAVPQFEAVAPTLPLATLHAFLRANGKEIESQ